MLRLPKRSYLCMGDSYKLFYTLALSLCIRAVSLCLLTVHACSLARTGRRRDCAVFSGREGSWSVRNVPRAVLGLLFCLHASMLCINI